METKQSGKMQELRLACIHKPEKMLAATLEPQV